MKFALPKNVSKSINVEASFSGSNNFTYTLPEGNWKCGVMTIGNQYRGVMVLFSTDSTKTQTMEIGSNSGIQGYTNFYSKMASATALSGTTIWNGTNVLSDVWIDQSVKPRTLRFTFNGGTIAGNFKATLSQ